MSDTKKKISIIERNLHPNAKKLLSKPDHIRIRYIKNRFIFIEYIAGKEVIKEILDLFEQPVRPRMEGMALISPTGNGKTTLIERFIKEYASIIGNLVRVEIPERATLKEFYADVLAKLGNPVSTTKSTGDLRRKIIEELKTQKVKMLFVDEIHNLLDSRREHLKDVLNGLKSLNNKAQIPIVLIGIELTSQILAKDDQVKDRYFSFELPIWSYQKGKTKEIKARNKPLKDLLATFEANLPLKKKSELHSDGLVSQIHQKSQGKIGRIDWIIRRAAVKAIQDGTECITDTILNKIRIPWD